MFNEKDTKPSSISLSNSDQMAILNKLGSDVVMKCLWNTEFFQFWRLFCVFSPVAFLILWFVRLVFQQFFQAWLRTI